MNPLDFLQSVAGFAQANQPGFDITKMRMATIDPAYSSSSYPGTLPKVTFDGETSLSGKRYPVMSPYLPTPSDRVVMVPLGATYLIIGPTDQDASAYIGGALSVAGISQMDGQLSIIRSLPATGSDHAYRTKLAADAQYRYINTVDGKMTWGSGSSGVDTNLYRSAANTLKTDDSFEVAGDLDVTGDLTVAGQQINKPAVGGAFANTTQSSIGSTETVSLTVSSMLFKAGWAYRAHIRTALYGSAAGILAAFRLRKTNASGADWGEFGRVVTAGAGVSAGNSVMVNGTLILVRTAGSDLTTNVALTASASTGTVNLFASSASPRYLIIEPIGAASDYEDLGVDVT